MNDTSENSNDKMTELPDSFIYMPRDVLFGEEQIKIIVSSIMMHALISSKSESKTVTKDAVDLAWHLLQEVKKNTNWE